MEEKPKYLIKFCAKEKYADDLMDGKLYMNAAGFYHRLEKGQGDNREGIISSGVFMYKNSCRPIYCMYSVMSSDIVEGEAAIPARIISGFSCAEGWAVVVEYEFFEELLFGLDTEGHAAWRGQVKYGAISLDLTKELLVRKDDMQLFIKSEEYSYQKEFRIVVGSSLKHRTREVEFDGMIIECEDTEKPYESVTYSLPDDLRAIARKARIADSLDEKGDCRMKLII